MRLVLFASASLLLTGSVLGQLDGKRWSQWRGPNRDGHAVGPTWPERLTDENFVKQWRVPAGPSYSGPVLDDERVYTTETEDEFEEVVTAYDRFSGEKVWEQRWEGAMKVPFFAARNGSWIRSTPTLDGDSLFVAGIRDVLVCLDAATGEIRWQVDFKDRYETPLPSFGMVCSPLVRDGAVYVQAGASFVKLDRATGEEIWRTLEDGGGMYGSAFSSPVFGTVGGKEQLLVQTREKLCGVDDADGSELWSRKIRTFRGMNILTPQPWRDGVFTSAYGGRAHYFSPASTDDGWAADEVWTNRAQGYMTSPVVIADHAYIYLRSKRFACVDLDAGEVAWISEPMGDTYWSLVAQKERLLALTDAGELMLIRHDPKQLSVVDTIEVAESETWAHLAVDGGQVFVRELDGLSAYRWGAAAAPVSAPGEGEGEPAAGNGG